MYTITWHASLARLEQCLTREFQCPDESTIVPVLRGHDQLLNLLHALVCNVAVEQRGGVATNDGEQRLSLHDSAAQHNAVRTDGENECDAELCEVVADLVPDLVLVGQLRELCLSEPCALGNGRGRDKALETVAVEGTHALKAVVRATLRVVVAHLGMQHTVDGLTIRDQAHSDTRADRDVGSRDVLATVRTVHLREHGSIDVSVELFGTVELVEGTEYVVVLEGELGRGGDVAVGGAVLVQVERSKAADAECIEFAWSEPAWNGLASPRSGCVIRKLSIRARAAPCSDWSQM